VVIYSCRHLGRHGIRCHGRQRTRVGAIWHDQSGNHARSTEELATYKVEPYVMAADIYAWRRISAVVDGRGTQDLPAGCIGLSLNPY